MPHCDDSDGNMVSMQMSYNGKCDKTTAPDLKGGTPSSFKSDHSLHTLPLIAYPCPSSSIGARPNQTRRWIRGLEKAPISAGYSLRVMDGKPSIAHRCS